MSIENPPAFPSGDKAAFPSSTFEAGMTLRDWFAGRALQGELASQHPDFGDDNYDDSDDDARDLADWCYVIAHRPPVGAQHMKLVDGAIFLAMLTLGGFLKLLISGSMTDHDWTDAIIIAAMATVIHAVRSGQKS
jgi:hypothetical protein